MNGISSALFGNRLTCSAALWGSAASGTVGVKFDDDHHEFIHSTSRFMIAIAQFMTTPIHFVIEIANFMTNHPRYTHSTQSTCTYMNRFLGC